MDQSDCISLQGEQENKVTFACSGRGLQPSSALLDDAVFAVHVCFQLTVCIDHGSAPHQQPALALRLHGDNKHCLCAQTVDIKPAVQLTIACD